MGANSTPTEMARCARLPGATLPHVVGPAWAPSQVPHGTCSRPRLGPAAFGVFLPQVHELLSSPTQFPKPLTHPGRARGRARRLLVDTHSSQALLLSRSP